MTHVRLASGYLLAQGVAVPLWWLSLSVSPGFRALFEMGDRSVLSSFALPDVLLSLVSLLAGVLLARESRAALPLTGVVTGLAAYSTLSATWWAATSGEGLLGVASMVLSTLGSLLCLHVAWRRQ